MPKSNATKSERLEARVPASVKAILSRAATLQGRSLTDFVVGTATEEAMRVIRENEILTLSARDQVRFADALLDAPLANRALRDAANRYGGERG